MSTTEDNRFYREPDGQLTLKQKLHAIMREVSYIQKDKRNSFHNYSYASEAAIKERLHDMFVKYGVLFSCDPVAVVSERERATKTGTEIVLVMQFHYCFEDVDSDDKREGTFFGSGADAADKTVYKAITGAIKYCLTTRFLIPTGDDPESDSDGKRTKEDKKAEQAKEAEQKIAALKAKGASVKPAPTVAGAPIISDGQRKRMYAIASQWEQHEVKALLKSFNYDSSKEVTADKYDAICAVLSRGPAINDVADFPDPMEYSGERIRVNGIVYRTNAELSAWEKVTKGGTE